VDLTGRNGIRAYRFGHFEIDTRTGELTEKGRSVRLQPQPSRLLVLLVSRAGELVARDELRAALWSDGTNVEFDQGLNYCISQIRAALGDSRNQASWIETVPKRGYRFVGEVETVVDSSPVPVGDPVVENQPDPPASVAKPDSVPPPRLWIWAIAAAALVLSAGVFLSGKFRPSNGPKSILVRTFIPTGLAAEEEWYADSLTQQVISTLAQGGKVNVRPFSTSLALKGKVESAREIGKRYGVDAVLEGSVRRSGSQLHVSVQLVDTSTERILWSHEDDREASDLSSIEKSILSSIARALQFRMEGTATVASRQPPKDRETYHLYLKANVITDQYRPEAESAVLYREVIRREPAFAPAHARLASVLARGAQGDLRSPDLTEAKQAAERAIGLDPTSAEAHTALAHVYMKAWKWAEAEPEFRTALTLDPNLAETRQLYGLFLASQGRFVEAIEQADRAVDLAPTSPTVWYAWAQVRLHARRFDDVIDGS
jgi:DNA-binding winged helix-turn-helix (wHTH) protein/TolB-like protein/cytochrome c-type biogenesis protein CcmH/NrfG